MALSLSRLLVGRPIGNREEKELRLGVLTGVPAIGLDALASAAYGPEAALSILAAAGAGGIGEVGPVMWAVLGLLALLCFSYWQTIGAYPTNGGSYFVARENLGTEASLLAASALMLDYLLNVAVAISAGVAALTSAFPALHPQELWICLAILVALTLVNLRGTRESGVAWAVPTYLFVGSLGAILAFGAVKAMASGGHPQPVVGPAPIPTPVEALGLWLLLRAFASGCTAMTGIEAVSNSVQAFRAPKVRHARATLATIGIILTALLLGISYLAPAYGVAAMNQAEPGYRSVLSQLIEAVYGRGWFYFVAIGSITAVLCLSANTSFVGFPRLCRLVAEDGFLPRPFAVPGRRLVYSAGILFLSSGAGALLIVFDGITERLIPLFAVGAFLAFTLSQAGMAVHWQRVQMEAGANQNARRTKLAINGLGAVATGAALAVILVAKFAAGAWLTVVIIPLTILLLRLVRHYYDQVDRQILRGSHRRIDTRHHAAPLVLVPIKRWDRLAREALEYALRISPDVTALHVVDLEGPDGEHGDDRLLREWRDYVEDPARQAGRKPRLEIVQSEFRSILAPVLRAIQEARRNRPQRPVTVVLPELVDGRWWGYLMHANRERRLRARLLRDGGENVVVAIVPWHLQPPHPAEAIAEEEPTAAEEAVLRRAINRPRHQSRGAHESGSGDRP